jgi:hypothetical protein
MFALGLRTALLAAVFSLVGGAQARAQGAPARDWGPGLRGGEPLGFEDKKFFTSNHAVATGFGHSSRKYLVLHLAYLFHDDRLLPLAKATDYRLVPYLGLGFSFHFSLKQDPNVPKKLNEPGARFGWALRVPVGLEWYPWGGALGLAAEVSPGFGLKPSGFGLLQGALIARYYY